MERVGFVGLAIMGSRMAANLRRAGYELTVFNRTRERADAFAAEHGATVAYTQADVGAASDLVITMVVDGAQVEAVLLGDDGAATRAAEGTLCVDMSTIAPADTRRIGAALGERGLGFVDAPVSGSSPKAEDGTLTIMAGGTEADFARARPLFEVMGELVVHVGELYERQPLEGETYKLSDDDIVDLEPLIRDALLLELPAVPLCRNDCRGLCPTCGVDHNLTTCDCVSDEPDPRWAALRSLDL